MDIWELYAFVCASLGVAIGAAYALRPFIRNMMGNRAKNSGDGVSQAELQELIARGVEEGNRPLRSRLEAVEGELQKVNRQLPQSTSARS